MPMGCFGFDYAQPTIPQIQSFQNMGKNEMFPMIPSLSSFQCPQINTLGCGMDPNILFGFPMMYCSPFQNMQQLQPTFFNISYAPSAQKIEPLDNC